MSVAGVGSVLLLVWVASVVRVRGLRRVLERERVEHRLTDGCLVRDVEVMRVRVLAAMDAQQVAGAVRVPAAAAAGSGPAGSVRVESEERGGPA